MFDVLQVNMHSPLSTQRWVTYVQGHEVSSGDADTNDGSAPPAAPSYHSFPALGQHPHYTPACRTAQRNFSLEQFGLCESSDFANAINHGLESSVYENDRPIDY